MEKTVKIISDFTCADLSGVLHKVDVLAVDKRFSEVRIACRCQVCTSPVEEDSVISFS